jgi:hypothetical protein
MGNPRWLCVVLIAVLGISGPLARLAAAQTSMQSMQPESVERSGPSPGVGAKVGAGVLNVVYVPGKAIVCGAGTIVAGGLMLLTFGSAYREAVSFFNDGCGGSWVLTPEQVAAAPKKAQLEY